MKLVENQGFFGIKRGSRNGKKDSKMTLCPEGDFFTKPGCFAIIAT
jgi:hypothetical protein